ncbi:acyl-CoA dehydrogenase [Siccirubricoccus deserti]|uniref:Acyl-CoA dehydrogenase family protein n=1 Tax=Siccirubricoccus deserti TaxID=2013562 RepID=A0A9X0UC26_9PROT|nr:acyl-CoA dehydrogenase family protein [Siccirubricoccus deserti]MBC4013976.1 acyl-CoA dehydrogenase family protein [Siccirubricoccus deserti]GGC31061.1 acyl-CoA dehydrogenase [Siccirubricoccus deserti]
MSAAATPAIDAVAYRARQRAWLAENLPPHWRADAVDYRPPSLDEAKAWEATLHREGFWGIAWPRDYGGHGLTLREHLISNQEIGRLPMPESQNSIGKELAGPIILAIATEEQKRRYLPAILEMREIWCQGFSEPEAGSDLAGLRTRATRDGAAWRINGQKVWTSGAHRAQRCLLLARTGTMEERHKGLSLFALKLDQPGVTVRPLRQITGDAEYCEVFFDNALVEPEDALGEPAKGWAAAVRVLEVERGTNRMYRGWRFEEQLRHLVTTCRADPALARLLEDSSIRQRIAQVQVDIEVLKRLVEQTVEVLVGGGSIGGHGSLSKQHWSEAHQRFAALAVELLEQAPYPASPEVEAAQRRFRKAYLQSRAQTIYAGTTEIQLGIIADRILKLPRGEAR